MASEVFSIGNVVTWRSQAQGSAKTKVGTIIEVVPPDTRPPPKDALVSTDAVSDGITSATIVEVATGKQKQGKRHYWPVVSRLKRALES